MKIRGWAVVDKNRKVAAPDFWLSREDARRFASVRNNDGWVTGHGIRYIVRRATLIVEEK